MKNEKYDDIKALTSLRFFAAALVFLVHFYPYAGDTSYFSIIAQEGHIGVTIFFALSGFLLTIRYFEKYETGNVTRRDVYEYVVKRIARIYPLYFFLLVINLFTPFSLEGVSQYTLTQAYFAGHWFTGIPTAWTLSLEEAFYFILPLLAFWNMPLFKGIKSVTSKRIVKVLLFTVLMLFLGFIVVLLSNITGLATVGGFMATPSHMLIFTIFGRFFNFACGIIAGVVYLQYRPNEGVISLLVSIGSVVGIGALMGLFHALGGFYGGWWVNLLISPLAAILIYSLTDSGNWIARAISGRLFVYLGKASFALYLLQGLPVFWVLNTLGGGYAPVDGVNPWVWLIECYIIMQVAAIALYELVESRSRKFILSKTL